MKTEEKKKKYSGVSVQETLGWTDRRLNTSTTKFRIRQQEFTLPHSVRNVLYNLTKYSNIALDDLTENSIPRRATDSLPIAWILMKGQFNRNINKLVCSERSVNWISNNTYNKVVLKEKSVQIILIIWILSIDYFDKFLFTFNYKSLSREIILKFLICD